MHVHTFIGKVSVEGLRQMDEHINQWLEQNQVEPQHITQTFCTDSHHDTGSKEPVVVTSIWYAPSGSATITD